MRVSCHACHAPFREDDDRFCAKCGAARETPPIAAPFASPVRTEPPRNWSGRIWLVLGVLGVVAFGAFGFLDGCERTSGAVVVAGGARRAYTFRPTGCANMQPHGRFGANIHAAGPNDGGVYISRDPVHGDSVDLEIPGSCRHADGTDCTVFNVPRDRCQLFDLRVVRSGIEVNEVDLVEGHLRLDCRLDDGTTVHARMKFSGC